MDTKIIPPNLSYAEYLFQWRNEPLTLKHNPVKDRSLEELRDGLASSKTTLSPFDDTTAHRWFIEYANELVGTVSLSEINVMMKTAEIGYMIGEIHHGKGIATAALKFWTEMIFKFTDLRKLTASVAENNIASIRVLEKVGYKKKVYCGNIS